MSTKTELLQWEDGASAFERGDLIAAADIWKNIADYSKIHFNLAIISLNDQLWEEAIDSLTRSVACDPYLAVAYYARGFCFYVLQEYDQACNDYTIAIRNMRSNNMIDYAQIGLPYKLFMCELNFNRALCLFQLQSDDQAFVDLNNATKTIPKSGGENDYSKIQEAKGMGIECISYFEPFTIPTFIIYKPPENKMKNAAKVDYLGTSKVVATSDSQDTYNGFSGTLIRQKSSKEAPKTAKNPKKEPSSSAAAAGPVKRSATVTIPRNNSVGRQPLRKNSVVDEDFTSPQSPTRSRKGSVGQLNLDSVVERSPSVSSGGSSSSNGGSSAFPRRKASIAGTVTSPTSPYGGSGIGRRPSAPRDFDNFSMGSYRSNGTASTSPTDKIKIKCQFTDTRMILIPFDIQFDDLVQKVQKKFNEPGDIKIRYCDEDNEMVLVTDQEDLVVALATAGIEWGNYSEVNRFEIHCSL